MVFGFFFAFTFFADLNGLLLKIYWHPIHCPTNIYLFINKHENIPDSYNLNTASQFLFVQDILWEFQTADRIYSSPIVDGELIYFWKFRW